MNNTVGDNIIASVLVSTAVGVMGFCMDPATVVCTLYPVMDGSLYPAMVDAAAMIVGPAQAGHSKGHSNDKMTH